jgi:DNA (cytosine-5)-methyltransferase 1
MSYRRGNAVDDNESWNSNDSDIELLNYSEDESDYEIVTNATRAHTASKNRQRTTQKLASYGDISLPDITIQRFKMAKGIIVRPGDTVELRDHSELELEAMHSGDFLRIKTIIMNMQTDEVRLRGYRLRRTKYLGQIFDCKCN